jgi:hypothetical protein
MIKSSRSVARNSDVSHLTLHRILDITAFRFSPEVAFLMFLLEPRHHICDNTAAAACGAAQF